MYKAVIIALLVLVALYLGVRFTRREPVKESTVSTAAPSLSVTPSDSEDMFRDGK